MVKIFKDKLIIANFLSTLFMSMTYPTIHSFVIRSTTQDMIAFNSIIICIGGIIAPMIWNKDGDKLYKKFNILLVLEVIAYFILISAFLTKSIDTNFYYIADAILFATITKNIICGGTKLKAKKYQNEDREVFDNNSSIAGNTSSLLGFVLSIILDLNIVVAFILLGIGISIDNLFYYLEFKKYKVNI